MWHRESHEGDAMLELVDDLDNCMLIHVKIICRIVVLRKQLQVEEADARNPFHHNLFLLNPNKVSRDQYTHVSRDQYTSTSDAGPNLCCVAGLGGGCGGCGGGGGAAAASTISPLCQFYQRS
jgi:hypothetical protein